MEKKFIDLSNNERYYYLEQGSSDKALILVHGNMSSSIHFMPLLNVLPDDLKVYTPDLRGFGDSSYNTPISSLKELAQDLKDFMDTLNIKKASFAGWSTGAGIILELAALYPEVVEKLILIEGTSHKGYPIFKKDENNQVILGSVYSSKEEMAMDPVQVAPAVKAFEEKNFPFVSWLWDISIYTVNKPSKEDNALFINETLKQRNLVDIDWALATINMGSVDSLYAKADNTIGNVRAKTLIIWSKQDLVVPYILVEDNYNALKDRATLKIYENGGHSPLIDNLKELKEDILNFIA